MKVGILTFHRAHNYGAVLQCYALQETLRGMGHDVRVINYKQPFIEEVYSIFNLNRFVKLVLHHPRFAFRYLKNTRTRIITKNNFTSFVNQHLSLSEECESTSIPNNYDVYIIGSDQVWNSCLTGGLDKVFWGDFKQKASSHVIGYAISTSLSDISNLNKNTITQYIRKFKMLSVREKSLSSYLKQENLCLDVNICMDPTLIAEKEIWKTVCSHKYKNDKYVLIYQARGYEDNPMLLRQKAEELANKEHLKIIDLTSTIYPPEEFVGLFRYASCVITTSFHAVAFSIIFNRQLYAIALGDGHDSRYVDLLKAIGFEEAIVKPNFTPCLKQIDYNDINKNLAKLKIESIEFLKKAI